MPAVLLGATAISANAAFLTKEATSDNINRIVSTTWNSVAVDFTVSGTIGSEWIYPDGTHSGIYNLVLNAQETFIGSYISPPGPPRTIVQWAWDFGDGNTGYGQNVTHVFTVPVDAVQVRLTVTEVTGQKTSVARIFHLQ